MEYQRPRTVVTDGEMDTFSKGLPVDTWLDRKASLPRGKQGTKEQKASCPESVLFELFLNRMVLTITSWYLERRTWGF